MNKYTRRKKSRNAAASRKAIAKIREGSDKVSLPQATIKFCNGNKLVFNPPKKPIRK